MNTILRIALLGVFIAVCYGEAVAAGFPGMVMFVSNRDGNSQIYLMNSDGSEQRPLTRGPEENTEPAWSPDGTQIAFTSYRDGNADIYVMDGDGSIQNAPAGILTFICLAPSHFHSGYSQTLFDNLQQRELLPDLTAFPFHSSPADAGSTETNDIIKV